MKIHAMSIKDNGSGEFQEVVSPSSKKQVTSTKSKPQDSKDDRVSTLFIGTSNIKFIDPQKWPQYSTRKKLAFTIKQTSDIIDQQASESQSYHPQVTVFHSLTNDIKNLEAEECVEQMIALIDKTVRAFPETKIIVSLATPRDDKEEWNIKGELVNAMLKHKLQGNEKVIVCDNNNLAQNGKPKAHILRPDGIHLSEDGVALLAANIKKKMDKVCKVQKRPKEESRGGSRQNRGRQYNQDPRNLYYPGDHYSGGGYYPGGYGYR